MSLRTAVDGDGGGDAARVVLVVDVPVEQRKLSRTEHGHLQVRADRKERLTAVDAADQRAVEVGEAVLAEGAEVAAQRVAETIGVGGAIGRARTPRFIGRCLDRQKLSRMQADAGVHRGAAADAVFLCLDDELMCHFSLLFESCPRRPCMRSAFAVVRIVSGDGQTFHRRRASSATMIAAATAMYTAASGQPTCERGSGAKLISNADGSSLPAAICAPATTTRPFPFTPRMVRMARSALASGKSSRTSRRRCSKRSTKRRFSASARPPRSRSVTAMVSAAPAVSTTKTR